jgi:hypothetical protein
LKIWNILFRLFKNDGSYRKAIQIKFEFLELSGFEFSFEVLGSEKTILYAKGPDKVLVIWEDKSSNPWVRLFNSDEEQDLNEAFSKLEKLCPIDMSKQKRHYHIFNKLSLSVFLDEYIHLIKKHLAKASTP